MATGAMADAVLALTEGEIVVYPTDTLWGLGCDIYNPEAIRRIHDLKASGKDKPLSVAVHRVEKMNQLGVMTELARDVAGTFLPGPLTVIVERRGRISPTISADLPTIGLRVPDNGTALEMLQAFGPVTTTSANPHGAAPLTELAAIRGTFGDDVGCYLDGDPPRHDEPSTVVDATGDRLDIVREGVVKKSDLEAWL